MSRRLVRLTQDTLADLPPAVRADVRWEADPVERRRLADGPAEEAEAVKAAWVSRVLLEWGSCGRVAYVDDVPAGFVQYAPPAYFPGTSSYATAPLSEDAVQLATVVVLDEHAGAGLGRVLLQVMARDLVRRGVGRSTGSGLRAVEAVAVHAPPRGARDSGVCGPVPAEFLQRVGFRTVRPHPTHPRLRLDLRTALTWREEVGSVWERLIGAVRPPVTAPAPRAWSSGPTPARRERLGE